MAPSPLQSLLPRNARMSFFVLVLFQFRLNPVGVN
jgi:hypothetical protein